jgi:hypothetical protein
LNGVPEKDGNELVDSLTPVVAVQWWVCGSSKAGSWRDYAFSLAGLNRYIRTLLDELNQKPFKQLPGNRQQAFE